VRFLGIDPDARGAWAVLDADGTPVEVRDAPVVKAGVRRRLDERAVLGGLRDQNADATKAIVLAVVEATPPLPAKMGGGFANHARGATGACYRTALAALAIPYEEAHAATWKRALGVLRASHAQLRAAARRLFPAHAHLLVMERDHGRACALLIAEHARRRWNGRDR
jgi:hypothetical protein